MWGDRLRLIPKAAGDRKAQNHRRAGGGVRSDFSVFRNAGRVNPAAAGSTPSAMAGRPQPGRYTVVAAGNKRALYIPEIQELFEAPDVLLDALERADIDAPEAARLRALNHPSDDSQPCTLSTLEALDQMRAAISQFAGRQRETPLPLDPRDDERGGLRDLVVHIAQMCNLACGYCYAENLNKAKNAMSIATAEKVVERAFKLSPGGLHSVKFLGGEPTLAWDIASYLMDRFEAESILRGFEVPVFVTVTNGTRVTDAICDEMIRRRMYVLVSLDGNCEVHDKNRPFTGGRGSHARVIGTLKRMLDAGLKPAVEAVYTTEHLDAGVSIKDLVEYFFDLGIREAQITIALGVWHQLDTADALDTVLSDFAEAARWSVRSFTTTDPFLLRGIQFVLTGFATKSRRSHVCGAGRTFMAVNYDGEAFPCYLLESTKTSYGFIDARWDDERYQGISRQFRQNGKEHHPVCRECWANEICQSCLGSTFLIEPKIAKPPAWFCALQKGVIGGVLGEIARIRCSSDWSLFVQNLNALSCRSTD